MSTTENIRLVTTKRNEQSVQEVSKKSGRRLAKDQSDYWKRRLYHNFFTKDGRKVEMPEYYAKLQYCGRRYTFNLNTKNKDIAAAKARDIFVSLRSRGWEATMAEYAPQGVQKTQGDEITTVGSFVKEVERTSGLQPKTLARYAQYLRMIVASISCLDGGKRKFDGQKGRPEWISKIDDIPLVDITPSAAADWKRAYLSRAGDDPAQQAKVRRSFNTALRNAKSLFSSKIIHAENFRVKVPKFKVADPQLGERDIFWFSSLGFEKPGSMKFHAPPGITYETLLHAARVELRQSNPEVYKLLLLCLCAGLRRSEADVLLWDQIHADTNTISIEVNQFIQPKHDSCGEISVDPALTGEILQFKGQATGAFVVNSPYEWTRKKYVWYRCEPHWKALMDWLSAQGITAEKKNHELRKIFGDALTRHHGIYSASSQLRHATVQMTEKHYSDPRKRAALPVGDVFET